MTRQLRLLAPFVLLPGIAGCDSIGDGSTIQKLEILIAPVESFEQGTRLDFGTAGERYRMYDCFCSNVAVIATFTDGIVSDFSTRARFTSSATNVATVRNFGDELSDRCPPGQQSVGLVIPQGIGTTAITAEFGGLSDTLTIEVADASINANGSPASYELVPSPPAAPTNTGVAVGATLPLTLRATLDGRTRTLNRNVTRWSFDAADAGVATIDTLGVVRGIGRSDTTPRVARAAFGACTDISPTLAVNVGDVLGPLTLAREAPDFAADDRLAVDSDELLTITAALDFDGDRRADGSQLISTASGVTFTDTCTLRSAVGGVCSEQATTCAEAVPVCPADGTCTTPCRTTAPTIIAPARNRILAVSDNGGATRLTAVFPDGTGTPTTLSGAVAADANATTLTVAALEGYPLDTPWFGVIVSVIEGGGVNREDVRVTAVEGTTLTVVRGVSGTAVSAHAAGARFEQRSYASDPATPLAITAKAGTLTEVAIETPPAVEARGQAQLSARGTFTDALDSRGQRVTRLSAFSAGSPTVTWLSSDFNVAVVTGNGGLVTSTNSCGGRVSIRARASTSTDGTTAAFDPATTADDVACKTPDPLCDQVELCIATPSPLPLGLTCDTVTTCP